MQGTLQVSCIVRVSYLESTLMNMRFVAGRTMQQIQVATLNAVPIKQLMQTRVH